MPTTAELFIKDPLQIKTKMCNNGNFGWFHEWFSKYVSTYKTLHTYYGKVPPICSSVIGMLISLETITSKVYLFARIKKYNQRFVISFLLVWKV